MTVRSITQSYEQSSEAGRERHVTIPRSRLNDTTPTLGDPAMVTCLTAGQELTGTVVNPGSVADPYAIINVAEGAVYVHNVRNVLTYDGADNEATWGPVNIGDTVDVKVLSIDDQGRIKLSRKALLSDQTDDKPPSEGSSQRKRGKDRRRGGKPRNRR